MGITSFTISYRSVQQLIVKQSKNETKRMINKRRKIIMETSTCDTALGSLLVTRVVAHLAKSADTSYKAAVLRGTSGEPNQVSVTG